MRQNALASALVLACFAAQAQQSASSPTRAQVKAETASALKAGDAPIQQRDYEGTTPTARPASGARGPLFHRHRKAASAPAAASAASR